MLDNLDRIANSLDAIESAAHSVAIRLPEASHELYAALMEIRNAIGLVAQEVARIEQELHGHSGNGQS